MGSSKSTWISSVKLILISFGIVSLAMAIKFSTPFVVHFVFNQLPVVWSIILSWTKPPYIYIIANGIIITIITSSRFHQTTSSQSVPPKRLVSVKTPPPSAFASFTVQPEIRTVDEPLPLLTYESENRIMELKAVLVNGSKIDIFQTEGEIDADTVLESEDKFVISSSKYAPRHKITSPDVQPEFLPPLREKPLVPSTFFHRKTIRENSEGARISRVTRPEMQETLENTWKLITEGRHVPHAKYLKKSDTWQHHGHHVTTSSPDHVPKSKTFKNRTNYESPLRLSSSTKILRESSLGQDELNQRVEAFIKKFNEEMRLQRQESLNRYKEMLNRGA